MSERKDRLDECDEVLREGWCLCRRNGLVNWAVDEVRRLRSELDRSERLRRMTRETMEAAEAEVARLRGDMGPGLRRAREILNERADVLNNHPKRRSDDPRIEGALCELLTLDDLFAAALAHSTPPVSGGDRKETSE